MITPFRDSQQEAQDIIEPAGEFLLIHVKCSIEQAKRRDPKGLYADAEAGKINKFTGINHPFQEPLDPDITVDTELMSEGEAVAHVMESLQKDAIIDNDPPADYQFDITKTQESEIKERLNSLEYLEQSGEE